MVVHVIDFSTVSDSPLNPLGATVRSFLYEQVQKGATDPAVTAMVITGGPRNFSAGADLKEFGSFEALLAKANEEEKDVSSSSNLSASGVPSLIDVIQRIEDCEKPVVAALAGTALGGGLEVALACHYRIAAVTPRQPVRAGLPEVAVGVIPGAGGTIRLPRRIGLATAAQVILTGRVLSSQAVDFVKMGLLDAVLTAPPDNKANLQDFLLSQAVAWAEWAAAMVAVEPTFLNQRRVGYQPMREDPATIHGILHVSELAILPKTGQKNKDQEDGTLVLRAALRALRASATLPRAQAMAAEAEAFLECLVSSEGRARRHAFFAVRQAPKPIYPALMDQNHALLRPASKSNAVVATAVIGAGTMGGGIAIVLLKAGFAVTLVDINPKALEKGMELIRRSVSKRFKQAAREVLSRLFSTTNLSDLTHCQLVVEAVVEKMTIKQSIFATLSRATPPDALLLTNTSTLDIDAMATALPKERRARFAGWHFFSPAHVMKLVEIVVGSETSSETVSLMQALTKKVGKIGVVVGNCDGFCGNRMLRPYSLETCLLLEEGAATVQEVDSALVNFGMALGAFQMSDLAGNDVGYNIRLERGWVRTSPSATPTSRPSRYPELGDAMVTELGRMGQKAGKGWYDYDPAVGKGRTPLPSPEMNALVESYVSVPNHRRVKLSAAEIVERVLFPLVNEGFKCLEEGIARQPSDVDVVYLYGYGWPVWRGGPMYWVDHMVGLPYLLQALERMAKQFPDTDHYVPSRLLRDCVKCQLTVEEYYQQGLHKTRSGKAASRL